MSKLFVTLAIALVVLLLPFSEAATDVNADAQAAVKASVDQSNRFLAAEVSKQIKASQDVMLEEINNNNDENFRIFDGRMNELIADIKVKVALIGVGSVMLANAIVAFFLISAWRKYSYEKYLEELADRQSADLSAKDKQVGEFMKTLEPTWQQPQPQETVASRFGQTAAAETSQMNAWQTQPVYQGAWVSPQQAQPYDFQQYQSQGGYPNPYPGPDQSGGGQQ